MKNRESRVCLSIFGLLLSLAGMQLANAKSIPTNAQGALMFEAWNKLKTPSPGPARSVGFYTAGCIIGAQPLVSDNVLIMRPSRNRYYGHPQTIKYLKALAAKVHSNDLPYILMGDISGPQGGPILDGHASHNNGLDADIWYLRRKTPLSLDRREELVAPMYAVDRKTLGSNWGKDQEELVATAANSRLVDRIFVAPAIKKFFCVNYPKAPWLYKLRAWWGHDDHFHVRLKCPPDEEKNCQTQSELDPAEVQCGSSLDWWFSKTADRQWKDMSAGPNLKEFPRMPKTCRAIVPTLLPSPSPSPKPNAKPGVSPTPQPTSKPGDEAEPVNDPPPEASPDLSVFPDDVMQPEPIDARASKRTPSPTPMPED